MIASQSTLISHLVELFEQNYLPKMSIPVERRDLGDGWVLTCHGEDGGGLTLSDVNIKRENLVCQVMGGDTLFFPMFATEEPDNVGRGIPPRNDETLPPTEMNEEESILDHIRVLIQNAKQHGCWEAGVGGVGQVRPIVVSKGVLSKILCCVAHVFFVFRVASGSNGPLRCICFARPSRVSGSQLRY